MKMIRVIKSSKKNSSLNEQTLDMLKKLSTEIEVKNGIAIIQDNTTKMYSLFDLNRKDFVDDETYNDLSSAEKALEDYTESISNYLLADLADDLLIDVEDVEKVSNELSKASIGNAGYGNIDAEDIDVISSKLGVSSVDVETIAIELGYTLG